MIVRYIKQDVIQSFIILLFSVLLISVIFLTSQDLNVVEIDKLPFYLQIYTMLLLPVSSDFRYLFIFTSIHLFLFLLVYLAYLYYKISKTIPIEKYLPISKNKYLFRRYAAINIQILFILSSIFISYTLFALILYESFYLEIMYTYFASIIFVITTSIIDFFFRTKLLNK